MSEWIDIDDKFLPENGTDILVFVSGRENYMIQGFYDYEDKEFYNWDGDLLEDVTHWQPLPEPPK